MYIDWFSIRQKNLGQFTPVNDGHVVCIKQDGTVEWTTARAINRKGSYDSNCRIKIDEEYAQISVNPSRWNRKDNVIGLDLDAALKVVNKIMADQGQPAFTAGDVKENQRGEMIYFGACVTRIDVCQNIATGSRENAKAYIRHLSRMVLPHSRTSRKKTTIYFNKSSTRRTRKAYVKADEIRARKKQTSEYRENVVTWCDTQGLVRLEVKYGANWLRGKNLRAIQHLTREKLEEHFMSDIDPLKQDVPEDNLETLTAQELGVLTMWQAGHNPREKYSQSAFYRYRKVIKEKTGYDIADDTIVPFRAAKKVIVLKEVTPPDWYEMPDGRTYAETLKEG